MGIGLTGNEWKQTTSQEMMVAGLTVETEKRAHPRDILGGE